MINFSGHEGDMDEFIAYFSVRLKKTTIMDLFLATFFRFSLHFFSNFSGPGYRMGTVGMA